MSKLLNKVEIKDSTVTFVSSVTIGVFGIVTTALFARLLGASDFGRFSFLLVKGALFGTLMFPGLNVIFSREVIKGRIEDVCGVGAILALLSYALFGFALAVHFGKATWSNHALPLLYLPVIVGEFSYGVFQSQSKFWAFNITRLANSFSTLLFALFLHLFSPEVVAVDLFVFLCILRGIVLNISLLQSMNLFKNRRFHRAFSLVKEGFMNTLVGMGHSAFGYFVNTLIGVGSRELGFFNAGTSIPNKLKDHIKNVFAVLIVRRVKKGSQEYHRLGKLYFYFFLFLIFCSTLNAFLSKHYVHLLLGKDFQESYKVFSIFGFVISIGVYTSYFLNGLIYFKDVTTAFVRLSSLGLFLDFAFVGGFYLLGQKSGASVAMAILASRTTSLLVLAYFSRYLRPR